MTTTGRRTFIHIGAWIMLLGLIGCFLPQVVSSQSRALDIYANGNVQLLIIDPNGRRLGFDSKTGTYYEEIPRSGIGAAGIDIVTDEGGEADSSQLNPIEAMINDPLDGEYSIKVFGTSRNFYYVNVRARHSARPITNISDGGIIDSGMVKEFRVHYNFADRTNTVISRVIHGSSLLEDLETSFKLGFFKNKGVYTSLKQKAENAIRQYDRDQKKAAANILQAFENEVRAQTDKGIEKDAADILLEDAQALLKQSLEEKKENKDKDGKKEKDDDKDDD